MAGPKTTPTIQLVYPVGSQVELGWSDPDKPEVPIVGTITAVTLYARGRIGYTVAWWNGRARNVAELTGFELRPHRDTAYQRVGCAA